MLNQYSIDRVFDALGDPTRRRLVERLSQGPMSVSDLAKPLGITLAAVVQHLQEELVHDLLVVRHPPSDVLECRPGDVLENIAEEVPVLGEIT